MSNVSGVVIVAHTKLKHTLMYADIRYGKVKILPNQYNNFSTKELFIYYVGFTFTETDLHEDDKNSMVKDVISYYCNNFHNKLLFRSSRRNPNWLYKPLLNTKGSSEKVVLAPEAALL